jgi:hypothetical protein
MKNTVLALALAWSGIAMAQTSASFKQEEHALNAGGHPAGGSALSSASYRVTLDAVAEGAVSAVPASASFHMTGGFSGAFPPPGEVSNLRFASRTTLTWSPERSVGDYNVYRDLLSNLSGLGFGGCFRSEAAAATATDLESPAAGKGFFYLVTAENRLDEEGTKGFRSNGSERGNSAPCP